MFLLYVINVKKFSKCNKFLILKHFVSEHWKLWSKYIYDKEKLKINFKFMIFLIKVKITLIKAVI